MSKAASTKGIKPELSDLIQLRQNALQLQLFTKQKVLTDRVGDYRSAVLGRGMDFDEVRMYQPGDDVRNIDWRVTARSGEVHTKVFREERERPVLFYVNLSDSMRFGTKVAFKSVIAARICSLLSWAAADNGDRVGGIVVSGEKHREVRPRLKQYGVLTLLQTIVEAASWPGEINEAICRQHLLRLYKVAKPGSLIILLTDCYAWDQACWNVLAKISNRCQLYLCQVYDQLEASAPKPNQYLLSDGKSKLRLNTANKKTRENYAKSFMQRQELLRAQ